jgi:hypothetical protein
MDKIQVIVLPYIEPKKSQRTWNRKGYVASIGSKKSNLKEQGFHK